MRGHELESVQKMILQRQQHISRFLGSHLLVDVIRDQADNA